MKKIVIAAVVLCATAGANLPAKADEPCNMTFCMWGKLNGSDSSECQGQIRKFFNIVGTKKGKFNPGRTADARKSALMNECPANMVPVQYINDIVNKYGRLKG
ncbi:killer protein (plasmid) [Candidatus Symbiopectobacterium sp. 'North America']|uniref:killer protein n=1 Tax=Candidatus Symbiopectobacterium sp. 'North America' TaxID=2794574 RepID=UPI0018C949D5|nr:killer protein [Candidatus Symbiopectobacterium sp. 'North America']MBG6246661.1 killer protein [Candidatus Symbiopectobacterium sp. 'North America']